MYLEGSDQHRGWFHSSLLESCGTRGKAPFKSILSHGFVVDGKGMKMSKSTGNVISPEEILKNYGADILRVWVASYDYAEDLRIDKGILAQHAESYRKIRNTFRFMLGNLKDHFEKQKAQLEADNITHKKEASEVGTKLDGLSVTIIRAAGESGQLYGSVTSRDIAEAVSKKGIKIAKEQVTLDRALKTLGLEPIRVTLHPEVSVEIVANIARTDEEAKQQLKLGRAVITTEESDSEPSPARENTN